MECVEVTDLPSYSLPFRCDNWVNMSRWTIKWRRHRGGIAEDGKQRTAGVEQGDSKARVSTSRVQEAVAARRHVATLLPL